MHIFLYSHYNLKWFGQITLSPFLFPFTVQITEGRWNWVTSEIVYCYRLVCAHATLTLTLQLHIRFSNAYAHSEPPIQIRVHPLLVSEVLKLVDLRIFNAVTGLGFKRLPLSYEIEHGHFPKVNEFLNLKRYRIYNTEFSINNVIKRF